MKYINVWENNETHLDNFIDERGGIADIFYNENINHVAIITSESDSIRGDHCHGLTTQHTLVIKGELEYWYKPLVSEAAAKFSLLKKGDLVSTPPSEIHALRAKQYTEFIVFTEGIRGGLDYEKDTYRLSESIINDGPI